MNSAGMIKMGKYISMLLRHHPEEAGIVLDEHGWTDVDELIEKVNPKYPLTRQLLDRLVFCADKRRYEYSDDKKSIRAVHGHSVKVDLGYEQSVPPDILYHGTAEKFRNSIEQNGLLKMGRQYVHLSDNIAQAKDVGSRHGKLLLYAVKAGAMLKSEMVFYRSASGVWLTDHVPTEYLEEINV